MHVKSFNTEFGYELIAALPFAYWHHMNGTLTGTTSAPGSDAFYFFSPKHGIDPAPRDYANTVTAALEIPNMWIHKPRLDKTRWTPPPLRDYYKEQSITFLKPTVVICNRYNREWERDPINYFDLDALRALFAMLCPTYSVVYVNVRGREELEDNAHSLDLGDYDMIEKEFPEVINIHDLVERYGDSFNTIQCQVFAGCSKFITMNGGHSILCSYFGGENIIYTKECKEIKPRINSFYNWYHEFGGSHIRVVHTYLQLFETVHAAWVRKEPLLNILVRCHDRERSLARLVKSIRAQQYTNVRIIACYDNETTWKYLHPYPFTKMAVSPVPKPAQRPGHTDDYKGFLASNVYLNQLHELVRGGQIMYMDDDDYYAHGALQRISHQVGDHHITLWRAGRENGELIPSDKNMGTITAGNISGIAFCFPAAYKSLAIWEPWRRGDYRVIRDLAECLPRVWLNERHSIIGQRLDNGPSSGKVHQGKRAAEINAIVKKRLEGQAKEKAGAATPRPPHMGLNNVPGLTIQPYRPTSGSGTGRQRRRQW